MIVNDTTITTVIIIDHIWKFIMCQALCKMLCNPVQCNLQNNSVPYVLLLLLSLFHKWENEGLRTIKYSSWTNWNSQQNSTTQEWELLKIILYAVDMYLQIEL